MAFNFLGDIPNIKGLVVRFYEFGEEVVGKVEFYDSSTGKLGLIVEDENSSCLQLFYQNDCENCQIVRETPEISDGDVTQAPTTMRDQLATGSPSDNKVIKAHLTEDEMKKVFKEVNPRVPNIRSDLGRRRDDNPHLRNLIHVKLEKLLCGAPPPGAPEDLTQYSGILL